MTGEPQGASADEPRTAPAGDPAEVELLPLPLRTEAYLAAERALQERLGLDGP